MASLSSASLTLWDIIKRLDPNGMVANIGEVLSHVSPIIGSAPFKEGNQIDGDKVTTRQSLPTISRRVFNQGVAATKSTTAQASETVTLLSSQSKLDATLAELNGSVGEERLSEDRAHLMAQTIQAEACMLYDSVAIDPGQCNGLITRLNGVVGTPYEKQVIRWNTGNTVTNTTLLLVGWGPETVCGIYPRGTSGGLKTQDMGPIMVPDANNNLYRAYVTNFDWLLGAEVKDPRFIAAVRNIDMSLVTPGTLAAPVNDLLQDADAAMHQIFSTGSVNLQWYCSRALATVLDQMATNSLARSTLMRDDVAGKMVTMLHGVPVNISDGMTNTEASV